MTDSKYLWNLVWILTVFVLIWVDCFIYHVASRVWINVGDNWVANAEWGSLVFLFSLVFSGGTISLALACMTVGMREDLYD